MEKQQLMLRGIEHLSEVERLELFNVEELETRLEMAAVSAGANGTCNKGCTKATVTVEVNLACW